MERSRVCLIVKFTFNSNFIVAYFGISEDFKTLCHERRRKKFGIGKLVLESLKYCLHSGFQAAKVLYITGLISPPSSHRHKMIVA